MTPNKVRAPELRMITRDSYWNDKAPSTGGISASFQYSCAKNGKGLKIGTKEADTT